MTYRKFHRISLAAMSLGTAFLLTACASRAEIQPSTTVPISTEYPTEYATEAKAADVQLPEGAVLDPDSFLEFLGEEIQASLGGGIRPDRIADFLEAYGEDYQGYRFRERTAEEESLYYVEDYSFSGKCEDNVGYQVVTLNYDEGYCFLFTDKSGEWRLNDILFAGHLEDAGEDAITQVTMPESGDVFLKMKNIVNSGTGTYTSEELWYHISTGKAVLRYMCEDMNSNFEEYMYDMFSSEEMVRFDSLGMGLSLTFDYAFYDTLEETGEEIPPVFQKEVKLTFLWDAKAKAFLLRDNENHFPWYRTANVQSGLNSHTYASDILSMFYEDLEILEKDGSRQEKNWIKNLKEAAALGY